MVLQQRGICVPQDESCLGARVRRPGQPEPQAPPHRMVVLSSSISSRSRRASSCIWLRSCCSLVMYSTVFCSVMAWLVCRQGVGSEQLPCPGPRLLTQRPQAAHQLGVIRDQTVQGVETHLDVEAPLLLSRDVLHLPVLWGIGPPL